MKKRILHILVGTATVLGCYSSLMAAEVGIVNGNAKAYVSPEENAKFSLNVYEGEEVAVNKEINNYYEIVVDDEIVYIEKEYIDVQVEETEAVEEVEAVVDIVVTPAITISEPEKAPAKAISEAAKAPVQTVAVEKKVSTGEKVVAYAKKFIGTPYVRGGNSLTKGVDCSGFTQQVYKNFGVNLQRSPRSQYASNGYAVSKSDLKPGDLVFYGYSSVSHVAIYVGNGQIIHSPAPGQSVHIAPLWQRGDAPIIGYKRIFKD